MAELEAVLESALYVEDLERAVAFYRDILGLRLISEFDNRRGVALRVGPSILLLFRADETSKQAEPAPHGARGPGHVAFRVAPVQMDEWRRRLNERGVRIEHEQRFGDNPPSVYFRDPDGNLLELAVASIWPP